MENKLEQLLNSLIEKGWKPFGKNAYNCCDNATRIWYEWWEESYRDYIEITPRKITSKESWLWQFVCENGMVDVKDNRYDFFEYYKWIDEEWAFRDAQRYDESYEYRIIESALKDESELKDFLLSNIVIKDE